MTTTTVTDTADGHLPDTCFADLDDTVRAHFMAGLAAYGPDLFIVETDGDLFETRYLDGLPAHERQHHNCTACRSFINRYGSLVFIKGDGSIEPAMWPADGVPAPYAGAVQWLRRAVMMGKVTGVFLSSEDALGTPVTGEWRHFAVGNPAPFHRLTETAGQAMALKREHFGTLNRGLAEFPSDVVAQALTLLEGEALYRTEKVRGPAEFLHGLHGVIAATPGKDAKRNLVWRAVASAPPGYLTPRSSMIGTLLDDIVAGLSFDLIKRRFADKMHPLKYQRPQVAASAGNIAQAEKVIEQLGLAPSLQRRFARLDEVETVWTPAPPAAAPAAAGGVFARLTPKGTEPARSAIVTPPVPITWEKFARTVMPNAIEMDLLTDAMMNYGALVTAVHADAPPLFQWDRPERRNPVNWYLYHGGSPASRWGLTSHTWVRVTGISLRPSMWFDGGFDHQGKGGILILEGAVDSQPNHLALFPDTLRAELHGIRKTIEQFAATGHIEGSEDASACGLILSETNPGHHLRVRTATGVSNYHIDRWD